MSKEKVQPIKSPYPWFGGKSRVANLVWDRFGDVRNYVEPFFGSGAVLLARPAEHTGHIETVNDINCWLANFWRAVTADPDAVGMYASDPVNEVDLHARGDWLFYRPDAAAFKARMVAETDYYCAKSAGWWVWGQSSWIGTGWGERAAGMGVNRQLPHLGGGRGVNRKLPHLGNAGKGVNRQLPHLGNAGMGVNRQLPHLGNAGMGVNRQLPHLGNAGKGEGVTDTTRKAAITEYMRRLAERTARVRVCCGDWARVTGPMPTVKLGLTGMFLDPPYSVEDRDCKVYGEDDSTTVAHAVREYALAHGHEMRIALCGYQGEHDMPDGWDCVGWKAHGGYGSQGKASGTQSKVNTARECIWFSPMCIAPQTEGSLC